MPRKPQVLHPGHAEQHPALTGATVAIVSPENPGFCTSCAAQTQPDGLGGRVCQQCGQQGQPDAFERFQQELDGLGLDYETTRGKYNQIPERSFIIQNPTLDQVMDLGKRYGQEAVVWSQGGRHQYVYTNGPQAGMATPPTPGKAEKFKWHKQEPNDNYTVLPGPEGEPFGWFCYNLDFDNPMVPAKPAPSPLQRSEQDPRAAALRLLNEGVIAGWHDALLDLRMRELAKEESHVRYRSSAGSEWYVTKQRGYTKVPDERTSFPDTDTAGAHARDVAHRHDQPSEKYHVGSGRGDTLKAEHSMDNSKLLCKGCGQKVSPVMAAIKKAEMCPSCSKKKDLAKVQTMATPAAPKAPQAPGAKPTMQGSLTKSEANNRIFGSLRKSAAAPTMPAVPHPQSPATSPAALAGSFRPASPGAAAPVVPGAKPGLAPKPVAPGMSMKPKPTGPIAKMRGIIGAPPPKA